VAAEGVRAPALAADGRLAYIADGPTGPALWIRDANNQRRRVDTGPGHVRAALWSPAGDLIAVHVAPGGGELTEVRVVAVDGDGEGDGGCKGDGGGPRRLAGGDGRAAVPARWTADGLGLVVTESDRADRAGRTAVVLIGLDGRRARLAEGVALQVCDLVELDQAGSDGAGGDDPLAGAYRLLLREGPRGVRRAIVVDVRLTPPPGGGAAHSSWELPGGTATVLTGRFAADGRRVLLVSDLGRERAALLDVPVDTPGPTVVIAERPDADVERFALLGRPDPDPAAIDPDLTAGGAGERAVVAWNVAGRSELTLVDLAGGGCRPLPAPPRDVVTALLARPGGRELVLALDGATAPGELWICDVAALAAAGRPAAPSARYRCLVSHAPARPAALVRPVLHTLTAHDGRELAGWWYRPSAPPGPLPTLLYLHGGPEAQERPTFNPLFHALLARGIAVFAPNVRGSTGYGRDFEEADHAHRRFDGIEDVASCVRDLVDSGLADPERIGIAGRSYGGYLTLAALVHFPQLFRAGMDVCGMVDLETFYQHTEPWIAASAVTKYGDPVTQPALLRALSPLHRMSALAAPLLVVHGENDTNVPVIEAEQTMAAATARGVDCRYLLFPGEGHEVVELANRVRFVRTAVDWLAEHLLISRLPQPRVAPSAPSAAPAPSSSVPSAPAPSAPVPSASVPTLSAPPGWPGSGGPAGSFEQDELAHLVVLGPADGREAQAGGDRERHPGVGRQGHQRPAHPRFAERPVQQQAAALDGVAASGVAGERRLAEGDAAVGVGWASEAG
jgi:dipeptidyl aminopeptidase/acylaminoacyl peptidase